MRSLFPLTDFDFWAFLTAGAVVLAAADRTLGLGWLDRENWTVVQIGLAVAIAYLAGHVIAEVASRLLEGWLVHRVLGTPAILLFSDAPSSLISQLLYSTYFRPIGAELRARIERRAVEEGLSTDAKTLYTNAYVVARRDSLSAGRLAMFQNQYSMCRNVSVACLLTAPALITVGVYAGRRADMGWGVAALLASCVMLVRFLKYYRLFSVEVLSTYAGGAGKS